MDRSGDGTWPLTYVECRERFLHAARSAGAATLTLPIEARGPLDERLAIDVARIGRADATRVVLVMSGVHGIEGYAGSAIQTDALAGGLTVPDDAAVVFVDAVNPWGMAWWRRANEHNVDLNRNWGRDGSTPERNSSYDEVHELVCPAVPTLPEAGGFLEPIAQLSSQHGVAWVNAAISSGQYHHPDGLYFGGDRTEASVHLVADIVRRELADVDELLVVDLHTGHGRPGTYTLLSAAPIDSDEDLWIRRHFDAERIETTADTVPGAKRGQIARGLRALVPNAAHRSITFELGTRSPTRIILAERAEHWVHLHGDRDDPEHRAAVWEHRICSIPHERAWETSALAHGRTVLSAALATLGA